MTAIVAAAWLWLTCGTTAGVAQTSASGQPAVVASKQKAKDAPAAAASEQRLKRLAAVKRWGYQLRLIDPAQIHQSPIDMVVVDHAISAFRRFVREFTPSEVATMRTRPDGSTRLVIAYLSIGEAERYRFYWNQDWYDATRKPEWLGAVNPVWAGNYLVRFWDARWQALIFGSPEAYLERIMAQGYDGIYLDRADVFLEWIKEAPDAEARMAEFIARLSAHARRLRPDFFVIMQNAEELLNRPAVRSAIDAVAKEDLFYGIDHREGRNPADTVKWSIGDLKLAQRAGRPVFVVEYLSDEAKAADARRRALADGFVPHIAVRDLGQLSIEPHDEPRAPNRPPAATR